MDGKGGIQKNIPTGNQQDSMTDGHGGYRRRKHQGRLLSFLTPLIMGDANTDDNEVRSNLREGGGSGFKPLRLRCLWYKQVVISSSRLIAVSLKSWTLGGLG